MLLLSPIIVDLNIQTNKQNSILELEHYWPTKIDYWTTEMQHSAAALQSMFTWKIKGTDNNNMTICNVP